MEPTDNEYTDAAERMQYVLASLFAQTDSEMMACTQMLWDARESGATPKELAKTVANAISDGLNYGNWPWNSARKSIDF